MKHFTHLYNEKKKKKEKQTEPSYRKHSMQKCEFHITIRKCVSISDAVMYRVANLVNF